MNSYITTDTTTQVHTGRAKRVLITTNEALTGTVTVIDGTAGTTANVAIITNPTVGSQYEYWGFAHGVRIVTSAACDITVNVDASFGAL